MIDPTKIRLRGDNMIVQELTTSQIGSIVVPVDMSMGMQALVLNVAQTDRSQLCEDIYPGDIALMRDGAQCEHLGKRVFIMNAVNCWGVIRDGKPMPVNHYYMIEVDPEADDVDAETGLWTPEEGRDFPNTGWCNIDGGRYHVIYDTKASQRRIRLAGQVYVFIERDGIAGEAA